MKKTPESISASDLSFPVKKEGIADFLASSFVKGVGKVFASRIVEEFGEKTLSVITSTPDELKDIKGMNQTKIDELTGSFQNLKYSPELLAFLFSCGISEVNVEKIVSHYKKKTAEVIADDPYDMVENVWKLSFFTADKIGRAMNIAADDLRRLKGAVLTAVKLHAEEGSLYASQEETLNTASAIAGQPPEKFPEAIESLIKDERLIRSKGGLYLPVFYNAEKEGAERLTALIKNGKHEQLDDDFIPKTDLKGHPLSDEQKNAIKTVLSNPVTIITGGPGTGKTTAIKGIIELLESEDKKMILAAPTGRAAKRMSDLAGREAMTIHRLLGYRMGEGYRTKKLDADILIIDEASMLEQVMLNHLLKAIGPETKIVMVGDPGQLPSIGAGDVLNEMIASKTIPVVKLNENFRQKEGSLIAANAETIKEGKMPLSKNLSDFMIIPEESPKKIHDKLLKLVSREIPKLYEVDPKDIQVVTPQQEGPLGAKQLNSDIQERINPDGPEIKKGMKTFRLGDRVMQTSNSSERKTYNGETGKVTALDPEKKTLEVTFSDGKVSVYNYKELNELSLAYATSVHKLQGSETDFMVMPMTLSHRPMLYRNLLYTAVSRARKLCVLAGEMKAISLAVENELPMKRNSNFKERLMENL